MIFRRTAAIVTALLVITGGFFYGSYGACVLWDDLGQSFGEHDTVETVTGVPGYGCYALAEALSPDYALEVRIDVLRRLLDPRERRNANAFRTVAFDVIIICLAISAAIFIWDKQSLPSGRQIVYLIGTVGMLPLAAMNYNSGDCVIKRSTMAVLDVALAFCGFMTVLFMNGYSPRSPEARVFMAAGMFGIGMFAVAQPLAYALQWYMVWTNWISFRQAAETAPTWMNGAALLSAVTVVALRWHSRWSTADRYEYDVALSFASEDAAYVDAVNEQLRRHGVRTFCYQYETVGQWGKDLKEQLQQVYVRNARFCVLFVSTAYVRKQWTEFEMSKITTPTVNSRGIEYLPVRLDDTPCPDIPDTVAYEDGRHKSPSELCSQILAKLAQASRPVSARIVIGGH